MVTRFCDNMTITYLVTFRYLKFSQDLVTDIPTGGVYRLAPLVIREKLQFPFFGWGLGEVS